VRIDGSVALVTGAGSGLAAETARHLARLGAIVVGVDRDGSAVKNALAEFDSGLAVEADIADTDAVARAVGLAAERGALRVVVNCAAAGLPPGRIVSRSGKAQPLEPWRHVIEVNLVAAFDVTRQAAAAMAAQPEAQEGGRGIIIHTSSIAGLDGSMGVSAYASSKLALTALVQSTARDLAVWGIRAVAVAPGAFDTPSYQSMPDALKTRRDEGFVYPRRPGKPSEFAFFVQHLVENDYLNADCFRLDAGLRIPE
jgi:NAD(P)-dependent dehydrogenase (short-subunit alcohol dehydrogenase family)